MTEQQTKSMRDLFPGYYRPTEEEFKELWENCIFILDTNVLLNLYRYDKTTRDEFFKVLEAVKDRLWIPHQVALEFQENRIGVIKGQNQKLNVLKNDLEAIQEALRQKLMQYPSIPHQQLLDETSSKFQTFLKELEPIEQQQLKVEDNDYIRERIGQLFNEKIGDSPSKAELDAIYKDGTERYEIKYPPGFKDNTAEKKKNPHLYKSLIFKSEYGDLILWKEILKQVKEKSWNHIIFITDDDKEDWWLIEHGKTVSPRPELIEEALTAGAKNFYMYSSERFLFFARNYLQVDVEDNSIQQVEETVELNKILFNSSSTPIDRNLWASYFFQWLKSNYSRNHFELSFMGGMDIIGTSMDDSIIVGYKISCFSRGVRMSPNGMFHSLKSCIYKEIDYFFIVIISEETKDRAEIKLNTDNFLFHQTLIDSVLRERVGLILGNIENNDFKMNHYTLPSSYDYRESLI